MLLTATEDNFDCFKCPTLWPLYSRQQIYWPPMCSYLHLLLPPRPYVSSFWYDVALLSWLLSLSAQSFPVPEITAIAALFLYYCKLYSKIHQPANSSSIIKSKIHPTQKKKLQRKQGVNRVTSSGNHYIFFVQTTFL